MNQERQKNRYGGKCQDCGNWIDAGYGRLYRHSGANYDRKTMYRKPGQRFAYVIRCEPCYLKHDNITEEPAAQQNADSFGSVYNISNACHYN